MKIINEKGKLFGIINVMDLLVLLALLAVVAGVVYRLFLPAVAEAVSPTTTLTAEVRVRNIHNRMVPDIEKNVPGQVIAGNGYVDGANVTKVAFETYRQQNPTAEGAMVDAEDPVRVDAIFTIEATVSRDSPIIKIGPQEIRIGYSHYVKTKFLEFSGIIEKVELHD